MKLPRHLRALLGLVMVGGYFLPAKTATQRTSASTFRPRRVYKTVQVRNSITGKIVDVPEHNVAYFLSRRTDRWGVV